jgi:hypothetical protein
LPDRALENARLEQWIELRCCPRAWCCREAENRHTGRQAVYERSIAIIERGMMTFIDDDQRERLFGRFQHAIQARLFRQSLDRSDDDRLAAFVALCHDDADLTRAAPLAHMSGKLTDQFLAVRDDENAPARQHVGSDRRRRDRLAGAGRQGDVDRVFAQPDMDVIDGEALIIAERDRANACRKIVGRDRSRYRVVFGVVVAWRRRTKRLARSAVIA